MSTSLLIATLERLSAASSVDISANQDLDAVAKRLQADADFRVELGQNKDVWSNIAIVFRKKAKEGLDPEHAEQLMFLLRIVRNSVAELSYNQDQARAANLSTLIHEVVSQAAHTHYGNDAYILMLRAGVQALSNLLTGNDMSKEQIWRSLLVKAPSPTCDQNLLSTLAAIEDETVVLSTVILCYNCIYQSRERSTLLFSTSAGKKLLAQLINESHATSGKEERKSFEMIYTFFNHLIGQDFFPNLFEVLKSQDQDIDEKYNIQYHGEGFHDKKRNVEEIEGKDGIGKTGQRSNEQPYLSTEHVILFKMIDSRIYSHYEQQQKIHQQQQRDIGRLLEESGPPVSRETVAFLTEVFAQVSVLTMEVFRTLDQPGVGQHSVEDMANLSSGLMLLLGCFSHLSLQEDGLVSSGRDVQSDGEDDEDTERHSDLVPVPDWFKVQHRVMIEGRLVENSIELLRQAEKSLARVTKPVSATSQERDTESNPPGAGASGMSANTESTLLSNTSTTEGQHSFFSGMKRDIVRLVGNLAYRSRHVQDLIRQCNGLIVMLGQCNIDDANPYLREYAILAMKNILAGNVANQALIEELQPIEAVDHPALQEARVKARLDADTGRPVLTRKKATS